MEQLFIPLLDHLAGADFPTDSLWEGWQITRISGGTNNLLYRATCDQNSFAIKFTIRDARDRAGREYYTLLAIQQAGLDIAPQPILLNRDRYAYPVMVQTWLQGSITNVPPQTDAEWRALLNHLATIQTIRPDRTTVKLLEAVLTMTSAASGMQRIQQQINLIPVHARSDALKDLLHRVQVTPFPEWPEPSMTLCRCDPSPLNFVRRQGVWASVDWENSGWGDPAFELADLMAHPAYVTVPTSCWEWVINTYCAGDESVATRIRIYYLLTLVWWVARFDRMLYEIPLGLEKRLIERNNNWQTDMQTKYNHYLNLALAALP